MSNEDLEKDYEYPLLMSEVVKNRLRLMCKELNFTPRTVLDIGAFEGYWARDIKDVFPSCSPFMIEGDQDKTEKLKAISFPFEIALLSDTEKTVTFHKTKAQYTTGNSIYRELTNFFSDTDPAYYSVDVKTKTLSEVVRSRKLRNIDLIKLDVQGSEKDIILGGIEIVRKCKALVIELSLAEYNSGAPEFLEMLTFLDQLGFRLYDIIELHYSTTNVLFQIDAIFVHK
jgi:FkbM family methyltransferase